MEVIQLRYHAEEANKLLGRIASQTTQVPCVKRVSMTPNITVKGRENVLIVRRLQQC